MRASEDRIRQGGAAVGDDATTLRALLDVALAAAGERRRERVLRLVLNAARDLVGADYGAVGVPDGADGFGLFLTSGVDSATWKAIGELPRQHGLLAVLLQDTATVRLADIRTDPRFVGWPGAHPQMGAFLGVPIAAGGEVLAEIYLANAGTARQFTADDQQIVETLAAHAALAVVNAERLERSRELAIAEERTRLARDLHDSVTQSLFGLTLAAEAAATLATDGDPRLVEQLTRIRELAAATRDEMRSLVETLRPIEIGRDGLSAALRGKVELAQRMHDTTITLDIRGEERLAGSVRRELLYVVGEALANALQHAQARHVDINLRYGDPVRVVVADDGRGFDLPATRRTSRRLGLTSLQDRVAALDGRLEIRTAPGAGTTVTVQVPDGC